MKSELIWLTTSLFAKKAKWHQVLKEGIKPFLEAESVKTIAEQLLIEFNYLSGENIRFAIQTDAYNAERLAIELDNHFKAFFGMATESDTDKLKLPVDGLFLPFPKNTIQYGLYRVIHKGDMLLELTSACAQCIISALSDDVIDDETLITFAFYLNLELIMQFNQSGLLDPILGNLYDYNLVEKSDELEPVYLIDKFSENAAMLVEIKDNIMSGDDLPTWLSFWSHSCKNIIAQKEPDDASDELKIDHFILIRNVINKQLGLTPNMIKLTFYFVSKLFTPIIW